MAILGILIMNAVSFGLETGAYFNISAGGNATWLDWAIGGAGEIFVDQKFMALFSMLFGAGIVLFFERAVAKGARAILLSSWRNLLLLIIGSLHSILWMGDILLLYAICAIPLIALHRLNARALFVLGGLMMLGAAAISIAVQPTVESAADLGKIWLTDAEVIEAGRQAGVAEIFASPTVELWFMGNSFLRALGMMLIGVGLYRTGVITGARSRQFYRRWAIWGLAIGLPLSAAGFAWVAVTDFSPDVALIGGAPNTLAAFPIAMGYLSLIALWNLRPQTGLHRRIHAAGRMALTNYLTQTFLGFLVLRAFLDPADLTRSWLVVFIIGVWALQLVWSQAWLSRFRYGPFEWLWRCLTYRRIQPIRTT